MRQTSSSHHEHLEPTHYPNPHNSPLNVERLVKLLHMVRNDHSSGSSSGKKRQASFSSHGSFKRAKVSPSPLQSNRPDHPDDASELEDPTPPVFRHVSEVDYMVSIPDDRGHAQDENAMRFGKPNNSAEKSLALLLSEAQTIDLGKVYFRQLQNRLVALSLVLSGNTYFMEPGQWLLRVPPSDDAIDLDALDFGESVEDILVAAYILTTGSKATIDAHLQLVAPPGAYDEKTLEVSFQLRLDITVSLVLPTLVRPVNVETKRRRNELDDAQRRFLDFLFPAMSSNPASFEGETNIPFFYSVLGPAPRLPSKLAEEAMQPRLLRPNLLPFQRRSVGWLLGREGKTVTSSGEIVDKPPCSASNKALPLFWDRIVLGNKTWYMNRLDGTVSADLPPDNCAMGGILAEEPGLGKTLMCISLILLNPAPGRNPTNKCWDPTARLDVKEIKTTLIVTPVALAPQWADELALHAPNLKVLIYEGWSKVQVPISEAQVEAERERRRKAIAKATRKTSATTKSKSKPKRRKPTTRKGKSVAYDSDDSMDVDEAKEETPDCSALEEEVIDWCAYINTFDVCITTYNTLRQDLNVARAIPIRPRREDVVYSNVEKPRSPLVMCEWYRVIMDEVQMAGGGKIEDMVSLLPRLSSFAVSGTPARSQVSDLLHVLRFLRVDDIIGPLNMWNRLLKPGFAWQFESFFQQHAIRTMKASVKDELTIPQQTRFLVSIDLGRVERHVYDQTLEAALLELGLDARGVAASEGWEVDTALLRTVLRRLRGICTHPQVGQLQKQGENLSKQGALKTMNDVLEAMKDQNWRNFVDDRRLKVQSLIQCAQLMQHDKTDHSRYQHAVETLILAEKETKQLQEDVKAAIAVHDEKIDALKKETATLREARRRSESPDSDEPSPDKGKRKALERDPSLSLFGEDDEDGDLPRTRAGEELAVKRRALQARLRECHVTLHRVKFLQGDVYHVLGASHAPAEDAAYEAAETIRRGLLKSHEDSAMSAMAQLNRDAAAKGLTKKALLIEVPFCEAGGIRSRELTDEADEIIDGLLNEQSKLLWTWRSHILGLLTQKLSSGGEADGQEYTRTLETQGEAETYLQSYAALLADRREALVAERTLLAAHDARERKLRHTKAAIKAAAAAASLQKEVIIPEEIERQPEYEVLHKELSNERKDLLKEFQGRALKSVLFDMNAAATRIYNDKDPEKIILRQASQDLRQLIAAQGVLMDKLEADLNQFRKAFNERILYFRQLQELSDSVAEVNWENGLEDAIKSCKTEQADLDAKINTSRARQRYLEHLARNKEQGTQDEDDECCILCRCEFTRGFITPCAHVFCEGCLNAWLKKKDGKACPVCRVIINVDQMQRFTVHASDDNRRLPQKPINGEPAPQLRREIHYNMIGEALFNDIQSMEVLGSYGSKIQTLTRHLLYLQATDPTAKSIVFSAWADSLHIIEHALITNGIPCLRIDQNSKKQNASKRFLTDPKLLVMLLHGERENAGLNLTCASRVFLVESVVHHGFELQAIARIDRMSQRRETEVYCYYAEDTVERNILDLAARQGQSLYTKDNSAGTLQVSSFALGTEKQPAKTKVQKGDFIFKTEDMLSILFPHMYFPTEYMDEDALLQTESVIIEESQETDFAIHRPVASTHQNAEAGPSRLRW